MPGDAHSHAARAARARLQRRYRPCPVRMLFVGESPPASGRFFYRCDSGLYRAIREAFCAIDPTLTDDDFLAAFQAAGCYLIDLCPDPVDHMDPQSRRAACVASERSLARTIRKLQPQTIVTVVLSIRENVERSTAHADWHGPVFNLPYPGRWSRHRDIFVTTLAPLLRSLRG